MHYDRHYTADNEKLNRAEAITDCIEWLGEDTFNKLVKELKKCRNCTLDYLYFGISLTGIEGYPAKVLIEAYVDPTKNHTTPTEET